jgi:hypothetical protein
MKALPVVWNRIWVETKGIMQRNKLSLDDFPQKNKNVKKNYPEIKKSKQGTRCMTLLECFFSIVAENRVLRVPLQFL